MPHFCPGHDYAERLLVNQPDWIAFFNFEHWDFFVALRLSSTYEVEPYSSSWALNWGRMDQSLKIEHGNCLSRNHLEYLQGPKKGPMHGADIHLVDRVNIEKWHALRVDSCWRLLNALILLCPFPCESFLPSLFYLHFYFLRHEARSNFDFVLTSACKSLLRRIQRL